METPFKERQLEKPDFFQRILKKEPKQNALIEINNILSNNKVLTIPIEKIQAIAAKYKVDINKQFSIELLQYYRRYLEYCCIDPSIFENKINELNHLALILSLNEEEVKQINKDLTSKIYKKEVDEAIRERRLSESKKEYLDKLEKSFQLPPELTDSIYKDSSEIIIKKYFEKAIEDQRFSPDEENELEEIKKSLNVSLEFDKPTKELIDKYRLYWEIENNILPEMSCEINLQKNETCHFITKAEWLEQKQITTRVNYSGPTLRIKIAKGLYWRSGSLGVQRIKDDVWQTIDSGDVYLTNKRIIFMGSRGNKIIQFTKVLDFNVFSNGIDIQKDSGKSPFLQFSNNTDIFSMILGNLISRNE